MAGLRKEEKKRCVGPFSVYRVYCLANKNREAAQKPRSRQAPKGLFSEKKSAHEAANPPIECFREIVRVKKRFIQRAEKRGVLPTVKEGGRRSLDAVLADMPCSTPRPGKRNKPFRGKKNAEKTRKKTCSAGGMKLRRLLSRSPKLLPRKRRERLSRLKPKRGKGNLFITRPEELKGKDCAVASTERGARTRLIFLKHCREGGKRRRSHANPDN